MNPPSRRMLSVGMVHVRSLPGTPGHAEIARNVGAGSDPRAAMRWIVETAVREAHQLQAAGFRALLIENMHDLPYIRSVGPEITACMSRVAAAIRGEVLAGANKEAMSVAKAASLDFVRVEGFVFGHLADEGYIDACAGELLRFRSSIGAGNVEVWADIKKKHSSHAITADVSVADFAEAALFFGADAVVLTGSSTDVDAVRDAVGEQLRIYIGSGVTPSNAHLFARADGVIVGSYVKEGGRWAASVCDARSREVVAAIEAAC